VAHLGAQSSSAIVAYHNGVQRLVMYATGSLTDLSLTNADLGDDTAGPRVWVGRNSNATNPNPGTVGLTSKAGRTWYLWASEYGTIYTSSSRPEGALGETDSTVVGSQSSSRDVKNIIGAFDKNKEALDIILRTPLYRFTYKNADFPTQEFVGLVTDEAPEFGQFPDREHPNGRALNVVNSIGYLMAAVKAQQAEIESLRVQLAALRSGKMRGGPQGHRLEP